MKIIWKTLCVIPPILCVENALSGELNPFQKDVLRNNRKSQLERELKLGKELINTFSAEQDPKKRRNLEKQLKKWEHRAQNSIDKKSRFSEYIRNSVLRICGLNNWERKNKKPSFVSIDDKIVNVRHEVILNRFRNALYKDIKGHLFKRMDRGSSWKSYCYQCAICSLNLTSDEEKRIPSVIRQYANKKGGLLADDGKWWKQIAESIKRRILVYEHGNGEIIGFYEYGKEYVKNGTKRTCLENKHYQELMTSETKF